jgi:hypothetical protein
VTQAAELLSFEDATVTNLSYSGFYWTLDLEQNAELRITSSCSPTPVILSTLIVIFLYNGLGLQLGNNAGVWQPFALGILLIGSVLFNEWVRRRLSVA